MLPGTIWLWVLAPLVAGDHEGSLRNSSIDDYSGFQSDEMVPIYTKNVSDDSDNDQGGLKLNVNKKSDTTELNANVGLIDLKPNMTTSGPTLLSPLWSRLVISSGSSVTINCSVDNLARETVTWLRDQEILSVNRLRYNSDTRISPIFNSDSRDQRLRILNVRPTDSATYHCRVGGSLLQTSTKLTVIDAYSVIFGSSEVQVSVGETLYLLCMVLQVHDVPEYILWYREEQVIEYGREEVTVKTDEETRSSELQVQNVTYSDSGNYTCHPSNARPAQVTVTVTTGTTGPPGPISRCEDCILIIQLGATFAFFTISFIVAFCCHAKNNRKVVVFEENILPGDMFLKEFYYNNTSA